MQGILAGRESDFQVKCQQFLNSALTMNNYSFVIRELSTPIPIPAGCLHIILATQEALTISAFSSLKILYHQGLESFQKLIRIPEYAR